MNGYNLDKLVSVIVNDFYPARYYSYSAGKKTFFSRQKEGWYSLLGYYYGKDTPKNHVLINGEPYEKPEVVLTFSDGSSKTYFFECYDDAINFANKLTVGKNWLKK